MEEEKKDIWSDWKQFPDPRKGEYLIAPFGCGVYQLRNSKTKEYVLFGKGKNTAYRMTSLLPEPLGQGNRNNNSKRKYVIENIQDIEYRTVACTTEDEMCVLEEQIKKQKNHIYNT